MIVVRRAPGIPLTRRGVPLSSASAAALNASVAGAGVDVRRDIDAALLNVPNRDGVPIVVVDEEEEDDDDIVEEEDGGAGDARSGRGRADGGKARGEPEGDMREMVAVGGENTGRLELYCCDVGDRKY